MNDGGVRHRLLAILAADAAGYSRLMAGDDVATLRSLDAAREVFRTHIEAHDGRVIDMAGDSVLASFETVGGAVNASREIQEVLTAQGEEVPEAQRLQFRIGIHLGDVLEKSDGTVYGDGVNIAARLQALAEPGGITVSHAVRDAVFNRVGAAFEDLGEQTVKNIERPVLAYRMRWERMAGAVGALSPPTNAGRLAASSPDFFRNKVASQGPVAVWLQSIRRRWWVATVVVALVGVGATWMVRSAFGPSQSSIAEPPPMSLVIAPLTAPAGEVAIEQLAHSLRRDLLTGLAAVHRSVMTVQSEAGDTASEAGSHRQHPSARYFLHGELSRGADGKVSVNLRMTDARMGAQFWGEQYELPDGAGVDSAIMRRRIAARLTDTVWEAEVRRVIALPLDRLGAMELVLRTYALLNMGQTLEDVTQARKIIDSALRLEPNLVSALITKYDVVDRELDVDPHPDSKRIAREKDELTRRAVYLDATDPRAWSTRSGALAADGRWKEALEASDQTIKLDPYHAPRYLLKAQLMNLTGRPADALALVNQAMALKPSNMRGVMGTACNAYLLLGQADEATTACEKAAGLGGEWVQSYLIAAYANRGDLAKATSAKEQLLKTLPGYTISQLRAKHYSDVPEYLELVEKYWYAGLRKAGIPE